MNEPEPYDESDLAAMRTQYQRPPFRKADLAETWDAQLAAWLIDAESSGLTEPNAMVLATSTPQGRPRTRTVLLKDLAFDGLTFYTNYSSAKGLDLAHNPWCSVTFPWLDLGRQVNITGQAKRIDDATSDEYFASRPYGSRLGAVASPQSTPIESRDVLEARFAEAAAEYPEPGPVPRPHQWGGYLLRPASIEFWQGRPDRLHDRLRYTKAADGGWLIERLAP